MKTVDRFLAGRSPIAEYKDDSFASDSDDSTKIWQAENKAPAKTKTKIPFSFSSKPDRTYRSILEWRVSSIDSTHQHHHFHSSSHSLNHKTSLFTQSQGKLPKPTAFCHGCEQTEH